jgi:hypothetical protein
MQELVYENVKLLVAGDCNEFSKNEFSRAIHGRRYAKKK